VYSHYICRYTYCLPNKVYILLFPFDYLQFHCQMYQRVYKSKRIYYKRYSYYYLFLHLFNNFIELQWPKQHHIEDLVKIKAIYVSPFNVLLVLTISS
jgi:hypothetical protein